MTTRVAIVTAYYKNEDMTQDWISNVNDKVSVNDKVFVVNAGSKPIDMPNGLFTRIDLPVNKSFSNSMNAGIKEALRYKPEYIVIIGNDTFPVENDWLDVLIRTQAETGADIVAPEPSNPPMGSYAHKLIHQDGNTYYYTMFPAICWLLPRYVIDTIGLFDEQFEIGCYEDDDYCKRVTDKKGSIVMTRETKVNHLLSQTMQLFDVNAVMGTNRQRFEDKWKR